jgi:hypothetical protein
LDTDSVYTDARTGDYSQWEPDQYYPYVELLKHKRFAGIMGRESAVQEDASTSSKQPQDGLDSGCEADDSVVVGGSGGDDATSIQGKETRNTTNVPTS